MFQDSVVCKKRALLQAPSKRFFKNSITTCLLKTPPPARDHGESDPGYKIKSLVYYQLYYEPLKKSI